VLPLFKIQLQVRANHYFMFIIQLYGITMQKSRI